MDRRGPFAYAFSYLDTLTPARRGGWRKEPVITIFHLSTSRSERIVWLAEELGLEYTLETFQREASGAAPPAMKALHALGKAPVIRDGDLLLAESGAIVEYLVHRHGGGRLAVAPDAAEYAGYVYWLHFAESSLMSLMLIALVLSRIPEAAGSPVRGRIDERVKQMLAYVDGAIGAHAYFAGERFSAADVMMVFPFTTMRRFLKYDLSPYANIIAYLARVEARPAYRKAMELAGPRDTY
jgi:glutathione S-transferase